MGHEVSWRLGPRTTWLGLAPSDPRPLPALTRATGKPLRLTPGVQP